MSSEGSSTALPQIRQMLQRTLPAMTGQQRGTTACISFDVLLVSIEQEGIACLQIRKLVCTLYLLKRLHTHTFPALAAQKQFAMFMCKELRLAWHFPTCL